MLLPQVPPPMQEAILAALPSLRWQLERLGLEVLDAEQREIGFAAAVRQPHFPMMAAVYFGAQDVLRWRVPPQIRKALKPLLEVATEGRLDPARQMCFALARDRASSEAAVGRFLLWCALLINLRIHTWEHPEAEAFGVLKAMEQTAEQRLKELLEVPEIYEPDVRPLHVLVLGLLEQTRCVTEDIWRLVLEDTGSGVNEVLQKAECLRHTRRLTARDAATLEPLLLDPSIGSQQLADRYPHHFPSAQAVDSQRSRALKQLGGGHDEFPDDRVIDLLQSTGAHK
jgi:hypothetical protein